MWDDHKQQRLDDLQQRAQHDTLTAAEQSALDQLLSELEQDEWASLRLEMSRLDRQQAQLQTALSQAQAQNVVLAGLAERYAALLGRARVQLAAIITERDMLRTEYKHALQ